METEILDKFLSLLDDRFSYKKQEKNIFSFSYSYLSDAIIFFKGEPLIAVEVKAKGYNDFDYRISLNQLQRYCASNLFSFGLVLWRDSATLLVESDGFKKYKPIPFEEAADRVKTRMNAMNQPDKDKLAEQFLKKAKTHSIWHKLPRQKGN